MAEVLCGAQHKWIGGGAERPVKEAPEVKQAGKSVPL